MGLPTKGDSQTFPVAKIYLILITRLRDGEASDRRHRHLEETSPQPVGMRRDETALGLVT